MKEPGQPLPIPEINRQKPVRWTAAEMIFALFFTSMLWAWAAGEILRTSGFYSWFYGPEATRWVYLSPPESLTSARALAAPATLAPGGAPLPGVVLTTALPSVLPDPLQRLLQYRFLLWSTVLASAFEIATVLIVFRLVSDTTPADLGLRTSHLGRNILLGLGSAVVLTPLVGLLNLAIVILWQFWYQSGVQEHPFKQIGQLSLYPAEWGVLIVSAVVVAPFWEELVFRGILQPWFMTRPFGGWLALGLALFLAGSMCSDRIWAARAAGPATFLAESLPVLALLPAGPLLAYLERTRPGGVAAGLFGTAVLFGWVHARVWPTPIALFVLGLALGRLAHRTRSLAAGITLHAVFNGAACLLLVLQFGWNGGREKERPVAEYEPSPLAGNVTERAAHFK
jgi:membrane protease YdiL (CAAX protease family)